MARRLDTIRAEHWKKAIANKATAELAWSAVANEPDGAARDAISVAVHEANEGIYSVPAPNLSGVVKKLEALWGIENASRTDATAVNLRKLIGDIRQIDGKIAGLGEPELSGRTTDMLAQDLAAWRTAVQQLHQCQTMLHQGPSESWGPATESDLVAIRDAAEAELLSLRAPTLEGVIFKLELIFADYRFDNAVSRGYGSVLGDLRRFARQAREA